MKKNLRTVFLLLAAVALFIIENLVTQADRELYPWAEYMKYAFYVAFLFIFFKFVFKKPKVNKEDIPRYGQEQDIEK